MGLCNGLSSEQEEADTKVLLYTQFAFDFGFERVNIVTVDTDLAILGMYFQSMLNEKIYLQYGISSARTLYDLKINWVEVLFKQCLVYMLLVVATQLAVSKEKVFEKAYFLRKWVSRHAIRNFSEVS